MTTKKKESMRTPVLDDTTAHNHAVEIHHLRLRIKTMEAEREANAMGMDHALSRIGELRADIETGAILVNDGHSCKDCGASYRWQFNFCPDCGRDHRQGLGGYDPGEYGRIPRAESRRK